MNFTNSLMSDYRYLALSESILNRSQHGMHNFSRNQTLSQYGNAMQPRRVSLPSTDLSLVQPKMTESPLFMLSDVAARNQIGKRQVEYTSSGQEARRKRLRPDSYTNKLTKPSSNILLRRVSELGGGFPMPKQKNEVSKANISTLSGKNRSKSSRIGAFPMPSSDGALIIKSPTLTSYRTLWRSIESEDLRYEIFQRKVYRNSVYL